MTESENPSLADVYAGDIATQQGPEVAGSVFVFRIEADAEPDTFARVAAVFNIANGAPRRVSLRRGAPGQVNITIEIELPRSTTAEMIRRKLEQLTCTILAECVVADGDLF
jgi:glycine cleavage system regulatory protein